MATTLGGAEVSSHLVKQHPHPPQAPLYQEDINGEYLQRTAVIPSLATGGAGAGAEQGADGSTTFSDPLSHFTDFFSSTLKEEHRLDEILMDDPLSPFGADPLLSAASPTASKDSSQRSSFSSDEIGRASCRERG